jgi:ABC-2 type transport system ATP-binding protein
LLDFIRPSGGSAHILGMDAQAQSVAIRKRVGFLPGELNLWENQTAVRVIRYLAALRGNVDKQYIDQLCQRLQFDPSKRVRSYSTGNKRKLGLVLALMGRPELLILDEPTSGLDPLMQQTFNHMMREEQARGATVFLSSHLLGEVQAICERVAILRDGELRAVERVDQLTRVNFRWVTAEFRAPVRTALVEGVQGVTEVSAHGSTLKFKQSGEFDPVLRALSGDYVVSLHTQEPTLEEIFLTYYSDDGQRAPAMAAAEPVKESVR